MQRLLIVSLLLTLASAGCGKRSVEIDRQTRHAIDTLTANELVVLRPQLDSLCAAQFDSLRAAAADSMLHVRRLEIEKILNR
jgi:hypothetical protein